MATKARNRQNEALFGGKREDDSRPAAAAGPTINVEEEIIALEKDLEQLRSVYELYFMGIERLEPHTQRAAIRSRIRRLREVKIQNSGLKFRAQTLQARIVALENYWGRINRQKEAGTYYRDVERSKRRQAEIHEREVAKKAAESKAAAKEPSGAATQAVRPGTVEGEALNNAALKGDSSGAVTQGRNPKAVPGKNEPTTVGRPSASSAADLTEDKLRNLYQTYCTAKRRCGEAIDLRFEDMAASLKKQVPKLMSSTGAQSIEFKVVIKAGHVVLKAVPK